MESEEREKEDEKEKLEYTLDKRKEKIIKWIKNPYNASFLGILIFAIVIRLYYFFLTQNQSLWWDEAEYMNMARAWAFGLEYNFLPVRPILFSLLVSVFFRIVEGEFLPRLLMLIFSVLAVAGMYYLGKEIYNEKVGLIASFLMSIFYLGIFHTGRLLVDQPSLVFFIFSSLVFYKYFRDQNKNMLYIGAVLIAIGTLFRITTATFLFAMVIYSLIVYRLEIFKRKESWIAAIIFLLILSPYIIWGYINFQGFVISQAGAWNAPQDNYLRNGIGNINSYISIFPFMFSIPLLIIFLIGLFFMYDLFLGFDLLIKGKNFNLNKEFFLLLLFIIPIITVSFSINSYYEDRYIINSIPSIFIISGVLIVTLFTYLEKKKKILGIVIVIALLGYISYIQLNQADNLTRSRINPGDVFKSSGKWITEHSEPTDLIIASSEPLTMYYSKRNVTGFPKTKEEFDRLIESDSNIKYFIVSAQQKSYDWTYNYGPENNLTVAQAYFTDPSQSQAILVIYEV